MVFNEERKKELSYLVEETHDNISRVTNTTTEVSKLNSIFTGDLINISKSISLADYNIHFLTTFSFTHNYENFTPQNITCDNLHKQHKSDGSPENATFDLPDNLRFNFRIKLSKVFDNYEVTYNKKLANGTNILEKLIPEYYDNEFNTYKPILEHKTAGGIFVRIQLDSYPLYANLDYKNGLLIFFQKNIEITNSLLINDEEIYLSFIRFEGIIGDIQIGSSSESTDRSNEFVNDVSQTFYEIMTQQPYRFDSSGTADNITSSSINVSWNYDSIIAFHNISGESENILSKLAFFDNRKQRQLPFINELIFDICGVINGLSTGWIDLCNIVIPDLTSYDENIYKTFEINKFDGLLIESHLDYSKNFILSTISGFDLRIYGLNYSDEFPSIDNRSIYFYDLSFLGAEVPSQPNFIDEIINSNSQFTLTYDVSFTELDNSSSNAVLNRYIIDYSQNETKASIIHPLVITDLNNNGSLNNISREQHFDVSVNGLRSGTTYNYRLAVKNNLNQSSQSEFSLPRTSNFTFLPSSNGISTTLNLEINNIYTNVSTQSLNNSRVLYINLSAPQSINPSNTSNQTIEISNPMTSSNISSQQNDTFGYGKYIDNSLNLVSLSVSLNSELLQTITFDGSFSSTNGNMQKLGSNAVSPNFDYISLASGTSLLDIWNSDASNQGFRLKGLLKLNLIANNDISNAIGDVSTNAYALNYNYIRHVDVGGSNQSVNYNIYVDDLSINPVITGSNSSNVVNVLYNFGIPSVKQFDLSFNRTYSNINSAQGFIPGNQIIADVNLISNTSASSTRYISISNSEINISGTYNFNDSQFDSRTSNVFNSLHYTLSRLTANNSLSWSEEAYSLFTPNGINFTFNETTNHYVDYESFSRSGTMINNNNINLSNIHVYELSNISLLGSNLQGLINSLVKYINHNNQIQEYSLLHINNKFQSNVSQTYPVIEDFSYNGVTITNDFSAGLISYDLSGIRTEDNSGYKYIAFHIQKSSNNLQFNFNGTDHELSTSSSQVSYLNIYNLFVTNNNLFKSLDISNLFDSTTNQVVGFVSATLQQNNALRIGNLKKMFNPSGNNWIVNGSPVNIPFNSINQNNYGSQVRDSSNNIGIFINYPAINDDLKIIIGIKNS